MMDMFHLALRYCTLCDFDYCDSWLEGTLIIHAHMVSALTSLTRLEFEIGFGEEHKEKDSERNLDFFHSAARWNEYGAQS